MDKTLQFLNGVEDKPFFLYYSPYAVHGPIQPVNALLPKYEDKPEWNGQSNAKYATMVENLDIQIGRLISNLENSGKLENTFILFSSDNGGPFEITRQRPLRAGKGSYYEGGIRVPMFASWKGKIKAGTLSDISVSNLDFYPTILKIAGVSIPPGKTLDGFNILPLMTGTGTLEPRPMFWHFPIYLENGNAETQDSLFRTRPGSAIRCGDWKLIQYFENNDIELYNLKEDPGEEKNLARIKMEKRDELLKILDDWRKEINAPVPTENNSEYQPE
jgi:arylsulfatase A-like enzyme